MEIKDFILKRIKESKLSKAKKKELASGVKKIELSKTQEWGIKTASNKRILGESVKLIYNEVGVCASDTSRYQGTIIKIEKPKNKMPRVKVLWGDDKKTSVWLFQVDFTKENIMLSPEERKKLVEDKLLKRFTEASNLGREHLKSNLHSAKSTLSNYLLTIEKYKKRIIELKEKIGKTKENKFTLAQLEKEFEMIKKLKLVKDIYISEKGNIIVLTKDLPANGAETVGFDKDTKLGRFVILLDYNNLYILINNRDWVYHEHFGHPHLDGTTTCWGHHGDSIREMLLHGEIFQLIDFIITFYSTYPQDHGSPHIDYEDWLNGREKVKNNNLIEPKIC